MGEKLLTVVIRRKKNEKNFFIYCHDGGSIFLILPRGPRVPPWTLSKITTKFDAVATGTTKPPEIVYLNHEDIVGASFKNKDPKEVLNTFREEIKNNSFMVCLRGIKVRGTEK